MCGILGVFGPKYGQGSIALEKLSHRGPNNTDYWVENNVFLGHKRLSIIDLNERSNQPFFYKDFILIYNGEIYNYRELIIEHSLNVDTKSDTEVLVRMFEKYGEKCLTYFNGMFAFLLYNKVTKSIFVARDRLGIKPLYYYNKNGNIIFASELTAIVELVKSKQSEFSIRQYKKLRTCVNNTTIYEDIFQFPAAHYSFDLSEIKRYWDVDVSFKPYPDDDELLNLLESSVNYRKISDVAVGCYLSGGLDSTILTYLSQPDYTWSVGFKELNEFKWSEMVSEKLGTLHSQTNVDLKQFYETLDWMIEKRREPLSVPNEVLIYLMTSFAKEKNTVILSGEGADELFFGYDRIFTWARNAKILLIEEFDEKYCYGENEDDEVIEFALSNSKGDTVLEKINYYFFTNHIQGLLRRLDNATMLCGVEGRVPFLDHRLVDRIAGCSFEWKMGKSFKEPLKRIFADKIPKEIINRKKVGFPVPVKYSDWLNYNIGALK